MRKLSLSSHAPGIEKHSIRTDHFPEDKNVVSKQELSHVQGSKQIPLRHLVKPKAYHRTQNH